MPDVMLPPAVRQVAPAQTNAKPDSAPTRSSESTEKSESNQGFSQALKERMQAEKGTESKVSDKVNDKAQTAEPAEKPAGETALVDSADGKSLPVAGNTEAAPVATQIPTPIPELPLVTPPAVTLAETETTALASEMPEADQVLTATAVAAPLVMTPAETPVGQAKLEPGFERPGPMNRVVHTTLPEVAQSAVAQAVREAIAERDAVAMTQQAQQRFGAEVRAFAQAQQRGAGFEAVLDRVAPVQQNASASSLPQGLQGLVTQDASVASARPVLPTTTLATPFRQPGWDQALSERVLWAASQKLQSAEIRLNPPNLGPIEVRVHMQQDQAQVSFTAQHAVVREALESSMPRLREMLNANGFNLVDVDVSQHSFAEQQRHAQGFATSAQHRRADENAAITSAAAPLELTRAGELPHSGIDLFA